MKFAKPYPRDNRKPANAEDVLKRLPPIYEKIINFIDEAFSQIHKEFDHSINL